MAYIKDTENESKIFIYLIEETSQSVVIVNLNLKLLLSLFLSRMIFYCVLLLYYLSPHLDQATRHTALAATQTKDLSVRSCLIRNNITAMQYKNNQRISGLFSVVAENQRIFEL